MKRITRNLTLAAAMIAVIFAMSGCMVGKFMCNYALLPEEHGNDIEGDLLREVTLALVAAELQTAVTLSRKETMTLTLTLTLTITSC